MKKLLVMLAVVAVALGATSAYADEIDDYIELLREDISLVKKAIVTEVMDLSKAEGERFWPIYDKYDREVQGLNKKRLKLIERFADKYWDMDDGTARSLVEDASDLDLKRIYLRKEYYRKFSFAIGATKAAKFYQLDNAISTLVRLQIMAELPLIEKWD